MCFDMYKKDKAVVYTDGMCYCEDKNTCSPENKQNEVDDEEKNSLLIHPVPSKKSLFFNFYVFNWCDYLYEWNLLK